MYKSLDVSSLKMQVYNLTCEKELQLEKKEQEKKKKETPAPT